MHGNIGAFKLKIKEIEDRKRKLQRMRPKMRRFAARICRNMPNDTADDVVQDATFAIWNQIDTVLVSASFETWVLAVVKKKAINKIRGTKNHAELDDEVLEIPDDILSPEENLIAEQRNTKLRTALKKLSLAHQQVVELSYWDGLTCEEIARVIGIPAMTVKTRMHYARKQLAELIRENPFAA